MRAASVVALVLAAILRLDAQWPQFRGPDGIARVRRRLRHLPVPAGS
jgi:hypothetical protein